MWRRSETWRISLDLHLYAPVIARLGDQNIRSTDDLDVRIIKFIMHDRYDDVDDDTVADVSIHVHSS